MEIKKYKYLIEFETIEENVKTIVEVITKTLEENLKGSLTAIPKITFVWKEIPKCENQNK